MSTYIESVLPSGRGIRLEKLTTKQFRQVLIKTADRSAVELSHQLLLVALRAFTQPLEWQFSDEKKTQVDVDKMLSTLPEEQWVKFTYEQLIANDYIDDLLSEPTDYTAALALVNQAIGSGGRAGSVAGKFRLSSGTL